MRGVLIGLVSCAALTGCFDPPSKFSKEDEQLLDAAMYAFAGIEDNTQENYGLTPWHRNMRQNGFEYWMISENSVVSTDDETNQKIRNSAYVRHMHRLSNPEPCVFRFERTMEFSKGESDEDFSAYSFGPWLNVFNFARAYKFEFVDDDFGIFKILLEGPRVFCSDYGETADYCENKWTSEFSGIGVEHRRFGDTEAVRRRARAIALIKKACPGKAF